MKFTFLLVFLIIFTVIIINCASFIPKESKNIVSSQKEIVHPSPSQPMSPGSAMVSASLLAYTEKKEYFTCSFRIITVHRYGPATPPLPTGSEIIIKFVKISFKDSNPPLSQLLQPGNRLKMSLSHDQALSHKDSISAWRAIKIY